MPGTNARSIARPGAQLAATAALVLVILGAGCGDGGRSASKSRDRAPTAAAPACGDLLGGLGVSDARIRLVSCQPAFSAPIRVLKARYRVAGGDAVAVEKLLVDRFAMGRMKFFCCGWEVTEPNQAQVKGDDGYVRSVWMASGETPSYPRTEWSKIPTFTVGVELALEDP